MNRRRFTYDRTSGNIKVIYYVCLMCNKLIRLGRRHRKDAADINGGLLWNSGKTILENSSYVKEKRSAEK